jgi:hypothetical protein
VRLRRPGTLILRLPLPHVAIREAAESEQHEVRGSGAPSPSSAVHGWQFDRLRVGLLERVELRMAPLQVGAQSVKPCSSVSVMALTFRVMRPVYRLGCCCRLEIAMFRGNDVGRITVGLHVSLTDRLCFDSNLLKIRMPERDG